MKAIGKVTVAAAGTPVKLYTSSATSVVIRARMLSIVAKLNNAGVVYVGDLSLVKATGVGVSAELNPGEEYALNPGAAGTFISPEDVFVDADNSGDSVFVTVV